MKSIEDKIRFFLDEAVCCEVKLNLDDYNEIEKLPQMSDGVIVWKFGNHVFEAKFISNNEWFIKFGINNGKNRLDKNNLEMTGESNIKEVAKILGNVAKCAIMFIKEYKPDQITFDADRSSRVRMYSRLIKLLMKNPEVMDYEPNNTVSGSGHNYFIIRRKDGSNSI